MNVSGTQSPEESTLSHGMAQHLPKGMFTLPFLLQLVILAALACLLYTRKFGLKKQTTFPPWAILEIALTSVIVTRGGLLKRVFSMIRRCDGSFFGLTTRHQVMVNLPGIDRLLSQSYHTLNAEPMQYTLFTRVFGATDSAQLKLKLETSWKELLKPIEDMFLNDTAAIAAIQRADIPGKCNSFITFSSNRAHMARWELSADVRVLEPTGTDKAAAVECNLQSLARDFGACVAIPLLYGRDFLERYQGLLDDFWRFDNDAFPLLMIGIPSWAPLKIVKDGVAARARLLDEMDALYRRVDQYQNGTFVDNDADMSDISTTALARNTVYARRGWSFRERAGGDLAILWGQNANTQAIFFWLLVFVYSTEGVLKELRQEVAPHFVLTGGSNVEIKSIDFQNLFASCPRLKACIYETYRMANEATSIRYVARAVTVKDGRHEHDLKPGMFVSAPHAVIQRDPTIFENPDQFVADRFLETDSETGRTFARYGRLRPWGSGAAMCKGRSFAEKEIMALAAAVISIWDISPSDGTWKIPTMVPGTGVKKPIHDVRVIISRRQDT